MRIVGIHRGPAVTQYEVQPAAGVKVSKITGLADDIALALAAEGVRIEAPIPGRAAVGIEVPNSNRDTVSLREILESDLRVAIMTELIEARHEKGISQKKLEELSGVSQPVIARMETGKTSPQLDTVLKVLASLGKTLAVVPLEQESV